MTTLPLSEIKFRDDLYPRIKTDPLTVQKYAEDLSVLPPIEVNQNNELIDGWHRWTAHKKQGAEEIAVTVTQTAGDSELLELAIERNSTHGLQLSRADKMKMARDIYRATDIKERGKKKARLAKLLSVSESTIYEWLSRIDKDTKEEREATILSLYLACNTQEEIAEAVGMDQRSVGRVLGEIPKLELCLKPEDFRSIEDDEDRTAAVVQFNQENANHTTDFDPPIYNVWKQQEKTPGSKHFGNSEVRWLDNLLYLYTQPFDVVVDPFAGGGSTIDICRKRFRRYFVSDRAPVVERESEIRKHDLTEGLPKPPQWKDVSLVYLDPPYWKQAEGEYSNDPTDLANMPLDQFNKTLAGIIAGFAGKLRDGAKIALIIQPTQWKAPEKAFTDHIADMLRVVKLPVEMRFSVPYESQQCTAQMVEWAKANRRCLVLTREIIVWRVEK